MKRGGPIRRRTPLQQGKGLSRGKPRRTAAAPLPPGQLVRPKTAAKRKRDRDPAEDGMAWPDVRLIIYARSMGRCEVCGCQLNIHNMEGHHRRSKGVKGPHRNCPCNALALCSSCHHDEVHGKPDEARELGRIVSKLTDDLPADLPVILHGQPRPVLLTCGGLYTDAD